MSGCRYRSIDDQAGEKAQSLGQTLPILVNDQDDLRIFPDNTFDFIYSNFVLQHIKPDYTKAYIREFLRVLAPGGIDHLSITERATGTVRQKFYWQRTFTGAWISGSYHWSRLPRLQGRNGH
jgi:ubiquinone/menaquinone biosynthesis C-methylase UbiE